MLLMRSNSTIVLLATLCLALQVNAYNFGLMLRGFSAIGSGAANLLTGFFTAFSEEELGLVYDDKFQPTLVSVNAFCQLGKDPKANQGCKDFGNQYVKVSGKWGCGRLFEDDKPACLFRPNPPTNRRVPRVVFFDEEEECGSERRTQYPFGQRAQVPFHQVDNESFVVVDGDEIDPEIKDNSMFYSGTFVADLDKYAAAFQETQNVSENGILAVDVIVETLSLAGIRYPIGKRVCQLCKGTCNVVVSAASRDACKYDACVRLLGGYKGSELTPSCTEIPRP
ncbi:hypothetical protein EC991_006253 [Linnemannia zychae]|nr:hypothetical protein EC991_006253 [Linnemannia zychae]